MASHNFRQLIYQRPAGGRINMLWLIFSFLFVSVTASAQVVATVGNRKITVKEFEQKFKQALVSAPINPPTKEQFLEDLIRFEMGVMEAKKQKVETDPIVQERIKQEIYKALLEKKIGKRINSITVTEQEMKDWYKKNPEIRTSHIHIQYRAGASQKDKAAAFNRAKEILAEVRKSKRPFEELVRLYSDDTLSKANNGDLGWQSRLTLVPAYYSAAVILKPNAISNVVKTALGYHIIKLTGRRSYKNADKRQVRAAVFEVKKKAIFDNYFASIRKNYKVQRNKKLIQ